MSSATPVGTALATGTVVCFGAGSPPASALQAALHQAVASGDSVAADAQVQVVVCDAQAVRSAVGRWPSAAVIAVVSAGDSGGAVVAALRDGAATCVRGADVGLVAAYVRSVSRRRGLLVGESAG